MRDEESREPTREEIVERWKTRQEEDQERRWGEDDKGTRMKNSRVVAWMGVGIMALGLPISFSVSIRVLSFSEANLGYIYSFMLGVIGTLLILIGGLIARPRHLWVTSIVLGSVYIASLFGEIYWLVSKWKPDATLGMLILPGLACIIFGTVMQQISRKGKAYMG